MKAFQIGSPLFNANITDSGLQTLLTADGLTKVSLYWARLITGETLVLDSDSAQQIQDLELIYCALTKKGLLKILSICGNQLTLLDLTGSRVTGEGFNVLQDKFTNMEKLCLKHCVGLTNQGLLEILMMCGSKLQDLNISRIDTTGQGLEKLQGKFVDLRIMNLERCYRLTDQGLVKLLRMCGTKLQDLNISETPITGQGLEKLQGKFAHLKTLNLKRCSRLTDQGFSEIMNISGPLLETVNVVGCDYNISTEVKNRIRLNRPNLIIQEHELEDNWLMAAGLNIDDLDNIHNFGFLH